MKRGDYDPRPYDMQVPISGTKPMPLAQSGPPVNYAFAPGKSWIALRANIPANSKGQLVQNTLPCQKMIVLNETGGGDLILGPSGISLNAPAAGSTTPGFSVVAGAALEIEIEDASAVWAGSVAGTVVSVMIIGLPNIKVPGQ